MNQSTAQPVRNSSAGQPQRAELDRLRSASSVSHDEIDPAESAGYLRRSVSQSRCVFALAGDTGEPWRPLDAARRPRDADGVLAVVVIRHDLPVAAPVPDQHLVVPWVPGWRRRPVMGWCLVC